MRRTRVGLVCGYLDPRRDGVAAYTRRLASHLATTGFEPVVLTTHELARADERAVGVARRWDFRGVVAAAHAVSRLDIDLVHVQFAPSVFGFSRAVGLLPFFLPVRIPLIVTLHEYGVWSGNGPGRNLRSALWSAVERRGYADRETLLLATRAACVLVPSTEHVDELQARFGHLTPALREVPIGLNVEVATGQRAAFRADVRRALGAAPDAPLVVFFGFLHPEKALDQLIAAVASVRTQQPDVQLLLVGGAVSHSVSSSAAHLLRRKLEQVAGACGMQDQVHFTGYVPDTEVSRLLKAADAAAFPFDAGVTRKSSSVLTAHAAGVPVVATCPLGEVGRANDADGVLWVPPGDAAELSDALRRVLNDRGLAGRLVAAGRIRAANQNWNVITAAHAEIYAEAFAAHRSGESTGMPEPSRVVPSLAVGGDEDVTA
jgi:glycosyltransferase involved in cell wall biosynthesis